MEESTSNSIFDLENPAIKNGILAGIAGSALMLLFYLIKPRMVFGLAGWTVVALFVFLMVRAVKEYKSHIDYMSFSEALKMSFLTYVVGNLIYTLFFFVLMNYIDPGLLDLQREISIDAIEKLSGLLGEEGTEAALDALENQDWSFGVGKALQTYFMGLIIPGFIIALIISAVMKDRKPVQV